MIADLGYRKVSSPYRESKVIAFISLRVSKRNFISCCATELADFTIKIKIFVGLRSVVAKIFGRKHHEVVLGRDVVCLRGDY